MEFQERVHAAYNRVMAVYAELGYPTHLINSWALPENDAGALLSKAVECHPQNVLEVGSYVGSTTCLLALHTSDSTRIHSIDPNFPLRTEMSAMGSNLYDCNVEIKTQELGQAAARQLGVHERVLFHAGGFAVGSTFTSTNADPSVRVPTIGATVCKAHGPFDFIFIDALHYEEAVWADLKLAATALTPDGVIAIHDIKGRWGSNVRRAVFRFLTEHDDFFFSHTPFTQLYEAIGFLSRRAAKVSRSTPPHTAPLQQHGLLQATLLSNLSSILVEMFAPKRVLQFGGDHLDMRTALLARGVEHVHTISIEALKTEHVYVQSAGHVVDQSRHTPKTKYDLCLCLGVAEQLEPDCATRLLQACVDASDRVVFGFTPPGEMGAAYPNLHPTAYWMQQFLARGYLMQDTIRPRLEPLTHADVANADYRMTGTYLLNLYEVKREPGLTGAVCDRALLETLLLSRESRIEDLTLQSLTQNLVIFDTREQLHSARQGLQYMEQEQQRLQQDLQCLQSQLAATQAQYEGAQAQLAVTQEELAATQVQLHDKDIQLQETQVQCAGTQAQCEDTRAQMQALETAFAAYKSSRLVRLVHKLAKG